VIRVTYKSFEVTLSCGEFPSGEILHWLGGTRVQPRLFVPILDLDPLCADWIWTLFCAEDFGPLFVPILDFRLFPLIIFDLCP